MWLSVVISVTSIIINYGSSAQIAVVTYTNKTSEEMVCNISEDTAIATWRDASVNQDLYTYRSATMEIETHNLQPKHSNFNYSYTPNINLNLIIENVQAEDVGEYTCNNFALATITTTYTVAIQAIPTDFSLDCSVPTDATCPGPSENSKSELICICKAAGVHPETLFLDIPGAYNVTRNEKNPNMNLFDLVLQATVPVTDIMTDVTCTVEGYSTTEPIPSKFISRMFMTTPPICELTSVCIDTNTGVRLTCTCTGSSPSDGLIYNFFQGDTSIQNGKTTSADVTITSDKEYTFSCRACNGVNYGAESYDTISVMCEKSLSTLAIIGIIVVVVVVVGGGGAGSVMYMKSKGGFNKVCAK